LVDLEAHPQIKEHLQLPLPKLTGMR